MFSIGEFARLGTVSVRALRHYDEIGLLRPAKVDPDTGYFPFVYHDLARWADERGYEVTGPGREVWVHMVDDPADVSQQVFEVQLPFTRPEATPS